MIEPLLPQLRQITTTHNHIVFLAHHAKNIETLVIELINHSSIAWPVTMHEWISLKRLSIKAHGESIILLNHLAHSLSYFIGIVKVEHVKSLVDTIPNLTHLELDVDYVS